MSATSIQPFDFEGNRIRTMVAEDGEVWWILKDVCAALGLSNPTVVAQSLDDDEVTKFNLGSQAGDTYLVSEPGVYSLVGKSRKPEAKRFKRWVNHEVLPSIRKTGGYGNQIDVVKLLSDPQNLMTLITNYNKAEQDRQAAEAKVKVLEPKAALADDLMEKGQAYTVGDAAKMLHGAGFDLGQNRLFELLRQWKWVFRTANGSLKPDQSRINQGHLITKSYASSGSHKDGSTFAFSPKILITGKGLALIHRRLSAQRLAAVTVTKELSV
jgi:anti-repressor protein